MHNTRENPSGLEREESVMSGEETSGFSDLCLQMKRELAELTLDDIISLNGVDRETEW